MSAKFLSLCALAIGFFAMPSANADVNVTLSFSESLEKSMPQINRVEKNREKVFRRFYTEGTRSSIPRNALLNRSRFSGTEWGNERLIPSLEDYTVPALLKAMFKKGVLEADPDFDGEIIVHVDKMRVNGFSVLKLRGVNNYMSGTVKLVGRDGKLIKEETVSTQITRSFSASRHYTGRDYAYRIEAKDTRIGPIAVEFSEKALTKLYPEYDARGAVFLSLR